MVAKKVRARPTFLPHEPLTISHRLLFRFLPFPGAKTTSAVNLHGRLERPRTWRVGSYRKGFSRTEGRSAGKMNQESIMLAGTIAAFLAAIVSILDKLLSLQGRLHSAKEEKEELAAERSRAEPSTRAYRPKSR